MLKLKVCGMRDVENIQALAELKPDFMGFIFYEKSSRFVGNQLDAQLLKTLPKSIKKVGVFVNANIDFIVQNVRKYHLDFAQLHGNEKPDFCRLLKLKGVNIIKAFSIDNSFVFSQLNNYKPHVEYFLFDAKGENYGGNGVQFDWSVLKKYDNEKPFLLAGGIGLESVETAMNLFDLKIYGIDVNSKFEIEPALKDIEKLSELVEKMRIETELIG